MSGVKGKSGRTKKNPRSPYEQKALANRINFYIDEWKNNYTPQEGERVSDALFARKMSEAGCDIGDRKQIGRFRNGEITEKNIDKLCKFLKIKKHQLVFDSVFEQIMHDGDLARDRVNRLQEYAQSIDLPDSFLDLLIIEYPADLLRLNQWDAFDFGNVQEISVPNVVDSSLQVHENGRTYDLHKSDLDSYKIIYDYVIEISRLLLQERSALHEINQLKRFIGMLLPYNPPEVVVDHAMIQTRTLSKENVSKIVDAYRDKKALAEINKNDDAISDILESRRTALKSEADKLMTQALAALNKATKERPNQMVVEGLYGKYGKEG